MRYAWNTLTADQYHRLLQMGDSQEPIDLVIALTGKSKNEVGIHEVNTMTFGDLTPKEDPTTAKVFVIDGVLYGMQDINDMSFGLFQDIMDLGKDIHKYLPVIMAYMYRPVIKMSWWSTMKLGLIAKWAPKLSNRWGFKWMAKTMVNLKYKIEKYDPTECDKRVDLLGNAPASTSHHLVTFFLIFSQQLQKNSRTSLLEKLQLMKEMVTKQLEEPT